MDEARPREITRPALAGGAVGVALMTVVLAALIGYGLNHIPQPEHFGPFWWGNTAVPFVVMPFVAGRIVPWRWQGAALLGALTNVAAVCGFYRSQQTNMGASWTWLFSSPWIIYGAVVGLVCGLLGQLGRTGRRWPLVVCSLAPIAEAALLGLRILGTVPYLPLLWRSPPHPYPWTVGNLLGWGIEVAVGLLGIAYALRRPRQ